MLPRIIKVILENNSIAKTALSQQANVNYVRLSKHLRWLEKRNLIELIIQGRSIGIILTESGRKFAVTLTNLAS
jgi:predicted transcriptional regulator